LVTKTPIPKSILSKFFLRNPSENKNLKQFILLLSLKMLAQKLDVPKIENLGKKTSCLKN